MKAEYIFSDIKKQKLYISPTFTEKMTKGGK